MTINDLPNGGRNIRLYTYDPPGSTYYQAGVTHMYNTGHFDLCLTGGPCSVSDPQGFDDWASMSSYVQSRGEWGLVLVTRNDLPALCAIPTKGVGTLYQQQCGGTTVTGTPIKTPVQTQVGAGPGGSPTTGGVTDVSVTPAGATNPNPPGSVPPPGTPISQGGVPTGSTVGKTFQGLNALYRFILHDPSNPDGPWSTGANYPGCSQVNTALCDPRAFQTENAAIDYALSHGEIPYLVLTPNEVWGIISGASPINQERILSGTGMGLGTIALLAGAAYLLFRR
jgi:hypothetical protein